MEFTIDQSAIINSTKNLLVHNYTGSGVTEAINVAIKNKIRSKILLIAASESGKQQFINRFETDRIKNVKVETAFSLAWNKVGHKQIAVKKDGYSPFEIKNILNINSADTIHDLRLASFINRMCICQCNSTSERDIKANFLKTLFREEDITFFWQNERQLFEYANAFIDLMYRWRIPCIPEFCLQLYYQARPVINCDFIIVEDAPNTSKAVLNVIKSQKALKFIFGDEHQKLKLCNDWQSVFEDSMYIGKSLNNSFIHSENVTNHINEFIGWKKYLYENFDYPLLECSASVKNKRINAFIGKNKVAVLNKAFEIYCNGEESKSAFFEQGIDFYLINRDGISLYDILHLYKEEQSRIAHPLVRSIGSIEVLEEYAQIMKDQNCLGLIQMVKKHRKGLSEMIRKVSRSESKNKEARKSTINFSSSLLPGRYDEVTLLKDFINEVDILEATNSSCSVDFFQLEHEINLLYHTASRAMSKLDFEADSSRTNVSSNDNSLVNKKKIKTRDEKTDRNSSDFVFNLERSKNHHKNIFNKWTAEQDQFLVNMHQKDKSISDIASTLKRTKSAVTSRLRKLTESE